jgi:hypothetical protein
MEVLVQVHIKVEITAQNITSLMKKHQIFMETMSINLQSLINFNLANLKSIFVQSQLNIRLGS